MGAAPCDPLCEGMLGDPKVAYSPGGMVDALKKAEELVGDPPAMRTMIISRGPFVGPCAN
jgi:hypothetical protein